MVEELKKLEPATYFGPPARLATAKKRISAAAAASRKRKEGASDSIFFGMVTGRSLFPSKPLHRTSELRVRDYRSLAENRVRSQHRHVLAIQQNVALRVHREAAHCPSYWTRQAQPARRINKQYDAVADAV